MEIPTKIIFHGDYARCQAVLRIARGRLELLSDRLKRGDGAVQQGWQRPVTLNTGEVIKLGVSFNTSVIEIFAEVGGIKPEQPENKECFCDCNLSFGVISKITAKLDSYIQMYNIEVCNNKERYVIYENITASDFTKYLVGQKIIVMAYNDFTYSCCGGASGPSGCSPKVSTLATSNALWRTTYRILPICGAKIPQWKDNA